MASQQIRDVFGRLLQDLRISVTDRCNFRCTYCMPKELFGERYEFLPRDQILSFEEIERLSRVFIGLGVTKLRITGGEPLLRADLPELIRMLAPLDGLEDLSLTTNGFLLPQMAQGLKDAGLHRVTISLDSLNDDVFGEMNGRGFHVDRVLQAIQAAEGVGLGPVKINSVVQRGVNDHLMVDMAEHFRKSGNILRFIEYMDVGTLNGWRLDDVVPSRDLVARIDAAHPIEPESRSVASETAERYRYKDGSGQIGFISSVTEPFCGECTRARLSTDGKLFTCLFAADGRDLRDPLRADATDSEIEAIITKIWGERTDRYSEERTEETAALRQEQGSKVEMFRIGG
jgi:cyclic pyranopterin phosphate synthase